MTANETHVFAANYADELWLSTVDLHGAVTGSGEEPLSRLPGAELTVSQDREQLTILLDLDGVRKLRLACQRLEREARNQGAQP